MRVPEAQLEIRLESIHSKQFENDRTLRILLPPAYDSPDRAKERYPVLYLNDGQDLYDSATSTFHSGAWLLRDRMEALYRADLVAPIIIVGIDNAGHVLRPNEYLPWPDSTLRPAMPNPHGALYPDFVVHDVLPFVNSHYRTQPEARVTGIGGASYGALAAIYTVQREPGYFGRLLIESPSVYSDDYHLLSIVKSMTVVPERISIGVGTDEDGDSSCTPGQKPEEEMSDTMRLLAAFAQVADGRSAIVSNVTECARHSARAFGLRFPDAVRFLYPPSGNALRAD
ncbi:MAG TPA: alpha/beta hydrolase-fold protein [Candidatus Tumulicola sp.]